MAILNPDRLPTIIDVAREAGVSMKTVSRVINKDPTVRAKNLEKVERAIAKTGYRRNAFARGLRAKRTLMIGLLYEDAEGGYPADILAGALSACRECGYHLMVEIVEGERMIDAARDFLLQVSLDGVILTPPVCDNLEIIQFLDENDISYARISPLVSLPTGFEISIDEEWAGHALVQHLMGLGHTRIAHIRGDEGHRATIQRVAGYKRAHSEAGLSVDDTLIIPGGFNFEDGFAGAQILLERSDAPTAIFASNDESAAGVLAYAQRQGIKVPQDLSVVGFDGSSISRVVYPPLTTMVQPTQALAMEAVRRIAGVTDENRSQFLPINFQLGQSTAAPSAR